MTRASDSHDEDHGPTDGRADDDDLLTAGHERASGESDAQGETAAAQAPRPIAPPAPVVTDEGVYGTLPDRRWAEREYTREDRQWRDTLVRLFGILLVLGAAIWLLLYSTHQATGRVVAEPALESIVETMTGLPDLIVVHEEAIRATGDIPGYPLSVTVPAEDRGAGPPRWREVILKESSTLLYEAGSDAFNPEEGVTTEGTFSTSGGARLLIDNLSLSNHQRANTLLWPTGIASLTLALGVLAVGSRFGRFQALGIALAVASVPAIALGGLAYALVVFAGSDGSALAEANHEIAWSIAGIPFRNGLTGLAAGLALAAAGRIATGIFERERRTTVGDQLEYE